MCHALQSIDKKKLLLNCVKLNKKIARRFLFTQNNIGKVDSVKSIANLISRTRKKIEIIHQQATIAIKLGNVSL